MCKAELTAWLVGLLRVAAVGIGIGQVLRHLARVGASTDEPYRGEGR